MDWPFPAAHATALGPNDAMPPQQQFSATAISTPYLPAPGRRARKQVPWPPTRAAWHCRKVSKVQVVFSSPLRHQR